MLDGSLFSAVRPSSICIPKLEAHSITSAPLSVMCYYITLMLAGLATYLHSHILNFHSPLLSSLLSSSNPLAPPVSYVQHLLLFEADSVHHPPPITVNCLPTKH